VNGLTRLPGFTRSPPGREWALWKRLPAILAWGTAVPALVGAALWWTAPAAPAAALDSGRLLVIYQLLGLVLLHWTLVLTVAIGCIIVMLMKGPAFVADAYPPPGRDARD
jgi:hypothetical protein